MMKSQRTLPFILPQEGVGRHVCQPEVVSVLSLRPSPAFLLPFVTGMGAPQGLGPWEKQGHK